MKTCRTCLEVKPLDEFTKNSQAADGKDARCRDCLKAYRQARTERLRQKHDGLSPEQIRRDHPEATCTGCKATKPSSEFSIQRTNTNGLNYRCRACDAKHYEDRREQHAEYMADWYKKNAEHAKKKMREWQKANPEKMKEYRKKR